MTDRTIKKVKSEEEEIDHVFPIGSHTCYLAKHPAYPPRGKVRAVNWKDKDDEYR